MPGRGVLTSNLAQSPSSQQSILPNFFWLVYLMMGKSLKIPVIQSISSVQLPRALSYELTFG
jgi:hypothetical protein